MILGRRRISNPLSRKAHHSARRFRFVDAHFDRASFQTRYTLFLLSSCLGSFLLFALPIAHFYGQNQRIFIELAYKVAPELIHHLEREGSWMMVFLFVAGALVGVSSLWLGHRLSQHLLTPLHRLEKHMQGRMNGNLSERPIHFRSDEELRQLFETYNRLYAKSVETAERELELLEKIVVDPSNKESWKSWKMLIQNRRAALGKTKLESAIPEARIEPNALSPVSPSPGEVLPLRRVS